MNTPTSPTSSNLNSKNQTTQVFNNIYNTNTWFNLNTQDASLIQTESKSGMGSTLKQTDTIRREIPRLLKHLNITSILDAPCGDFNWMKEVALDTISYTGADIVSTVVDNNNKTHKTPTRTFLTLDIITDTLPKCDLILCRDCLVHLPTNDVFTAVKNFKKSGSTYLLTTTFTNDRINRPNMTLGSWQPINLLTAPFNFPPPLLIINENCTEADCQFTDKSLALWKLDSLNV